jgi:hypothetical protein
MFEKKSILNGNNLHGKIFNFSLIFILKFENLAIIYLFCHILGLGFS